jgi:hypothetical protein
MVVKIELPVVFIDIDDNGVEVIQVLIVVIDSTQNNDDIVFP